MGRPNHHWCGRRVMCDECYWYEEHERLSWLWNNGGAESIAIAYKPEGVP